jgi:DNA-directed RNA polymerase specialized sigma24 family protein
VAARHRAESHPGHAARPAAQEAWRYLAHGQVLGDRRDRHGRRHAAAAIDHTELDGFASERARVFERALSSLEQPLRDVVRLRLFEELGMEETATRLGIPLSTAKHRLVRGMQAYRAQLKELLGESPGATTETK